VPPVETGTDQARPICLSVVTAGTLTSVKGSEGTERRTAPFPILEKAD